MPEHTGFIQPFFIAAHMYGREAVKLRAFKLFTAAALALFLVLTPAWLIKNLSRSIYREFWEKPVPEWEGRIELWHIAEFRTYQGSVTDFLQERADAYWKKKDRGVHIDVVGLTVEKYRDRIARGLVPDAYSFPSGLVYAEQLRPVALEPLCLVPPLAPASVNGEAYAVPFLYSGYFLAGNTQLLAKYGFELPEAVSEQDAACLQRALDLDAKTPQLAMPAVMAARAGLVGTLATLADFRAGKTMLAVLDARALGDILRGGGDGVLVEAVPYPAYTDEVFYLGAAKTASDEQAKALAGFLAYLLSEDQQQKLSGLGALPVSVLVAPPAYGEDLLAKLQAQAAGCTLPEPFAYCRHKDALLAEATAALTGDTSAKASFFQRMQVVETGIVW